ncbi:MAG: 4-hydroxythreonine-4-phosphate dehydrogenase PdxA [Burkholderiaceae bacterium]|nr:4-hydroxythreonine-4-phosphate dehydrogenase PdxA [Burkholderiaceae bacterium]
MKPLIVTSGDPAGIGPEIVLKAVSHWQSQAMAQRPLLIAGDPEWFDRLAKELKISTKNMNFIPIKWDKDNIFLGKVGKEPAQAAFEAIRAGVSRCMFQEAAGLITAPIHKESLAQAGHQWPGHTEMLAELASPSAPPAVRMMLVNPELKVVLNSVHLSLKDMIDSLSVDGLVQTILLAEQACRQLGVGAPRIAVAGLNPHAGESGLFGREDIDIITPAIARARSLGINASGPWPGDTVFMRARHAKEFDLVVAQYHDQGLIPIKYLGLDQGINMTLGLPFIRTSVDHGTAFDIAAKRTADPGSMLAAIALADRLASQLEQAQPSLLNH